jgi:hypothetical protein
MSTTEVTETPQEPQHAEQAPTANLAAALAAAQGAFPPILRTRTVKVQTKTGGSYTFSYAPLDTVLDAVRAALAENGLAITQLLGGDEHGPTLRTLLLHESGEQLAAEVPVGASGESPQAFGSAMTYMRRYSLVAMLGIASEEDDDGNAAEGNTVKEAQPAARTQAQPAGQPRTADGADTKGRVGAASPAQIKLAGAKLLALSDAGAIVDPDTSEPFSLPGIVEMTVRHYNTLREIPPEQRKEADRNVIVGKGAIAMKAPSESDKWLEETLGQLTGGMTGEISNLIDRLKAQETAAAA